jgi:hypothetical protein
MALEILDAVGERLNTMPIGESCVTSHTSLIASAKPKPGTVCAGVVAVVAVAFPTVMFEVVHRHGSWAILLLHDTREKESFFWTHFWPAFST